MRRRSVVVPLRPVGSFYERALLGVIVAFILVVVVSIVVTLTVPSPQTRYNLNLPNPTPPTTAPPTFPPTFAPTTAMLTNAPTGPPTLAPSAAPTFPAVVINCPNDVTVTLGTSLESTFTGGAATATGGCSTPVIQYTDIIVGGSPTIFSRWKAPKKAHAAARQVKDTQQGVMATAMEGDSGSARMPILIVTHDMEKKRAFARSPSVPLSNLFLAATQSTGLANQGATGVAVSPQWVVWSTESERISVVDRSVPGTLVASFLLSSLGSGNCSAASATNAPQVAWDNEAQRWIMAHSSAVLSNVLCVYVSETSDPMGPYHSLVYADITTGTGFYLAIWGHTYVITLDESTIPVPSKPMCVLDREAVLAWNGTNPVLPGLFCGSALNPLTHLTRWSPMHADQTPPPLATESSGAGTPGAVFFRAIDDEYQFGETLTPMTDQLEVEHWYNLNWTVGTYGVIRYKFSVADFSQAPGILCGRSCVPTPTATFLNATTLMPKLVYRYIPATGQESAVVTLNSHSNDDDLTRFYWFELRWKTPTTLATEPIWLLYQQGVSSTTDGLHKFLPAACMDANGTIAIGYSASNNQTVYPGLWATSRLGNDPNNTLRVPISLHEGAVGSVIPNSGWGPAWSMACDPVGARWFYFSGAVSDLGNDRITWLDRIRVLGEIVERQWRADDYCGSSANCTQYITTV